MRFGKGERKGKSTIISDFDGVVCVHRFAMRLATVGQVPDPLATGQTDSGSRSQLNSVFATLESVQTVKCSLILIQI